MITGGGVRWGIHAPGLNFSLAPWFFWFHVQTFCKLENNKIENNKTLFFNPPPLVFLFNYTVYTV